MTLQRILNDLIGSQKRSRACDNSKARNQSRALAAKLGITLDIERRPSWGCWIAGNGAEVIEGDAFCTSWDEVLHKLNLINEAA